MKFLKFLSKFVTRQEYIYYIFIVLLIIPSIVLFFTEEMDFKSSVVFITMPLSIYVISLLIFKKPGYVMFLCSPLFLINGYQLVLLYLFGESPISVDMFLNLVSSDSSEAGELMSTIWPAVLIACVIYLPAIVLSVFSMRNTSKLSNEFVKWNLYLGVILFLFSGGVYSVVRYNNDQFRIYYNIYPFNVFYNLGYAIDKWTRTIHYHQTSAGFTFHASKVRHSDRREVYVLLIGETSRAENWSLFGYERDTNPLLKNTDGLICYPDILTQANTTYKIVPMLLSFASAENYDVIYYQKSLITAFKESKFRTVYISNQVYSQSFMEYFAQEADTTIFMHSAKLQSPHKYDGEMLPHLKDELSHGTENLLVILHTYGSHYEYAMRYPAEFACFLPDKPKSLKPEFRAEHVNAYDNSILYTDFLITEVISILKESKTSASMLYLSDHGEDLMDDKRNRFLHSSPKPTAYQMWVPMVLWFSENYRLDFPALYTNAENNRKKPSSSNVVFHTMLDMAGIQTSHFMPSRSLVSDKLEINPRTYLNDHDNPSTLKQLNLRDLDYVQFRKNNIYVELN